MSDMEVFSCEVRDGQGKGAARALRRAGQVPGVLYGGGEGPVSIALQFNEVNTAYLAGRFQARLAKISVDGKEQPVIARDVQVDPVKDTPIHVDLIRVDDKTLIDVDVSVQFTNDGASPGLKRGGVLNIVRHTVELKCPATRIPEFIEVDLEGREIGDAIHISAVSLPDGVTPTITDRDFTIATIVAPRGLVSEDAGGEEEAEEGETEEGEES